MSFTILDLPIEPIESRYSKQWAKWFLDACQRKEIPYVSIPGTSYTEPDPSKFLNPFGTFRWKFSQLEQTVGILQRCFKTVKPPERFVVFLHDGWMPGIECFPYISDLMGMDIKVCGYFHAGSWDQSDLLGRANCGRWARGSEESWFTICDKIFLGSDYHAEMIYHERNVDADKLVVTGCPVEVPPLDVTKKEAIVVWPHRLSPDKDPDAFEYIKYKVQRQRPNVRFVRSMDERLSKDLYYDLLARSKVAVSTALHENFGIGMVEAAMLGCYPICPNRLSYCETMESTWRYDHIDQAIDLVCKALDKTEPYEYPHKQRYNQVTVTDKIVDALVEVGNA